MENLKLAPCGLDCNVCVLHPRYCDGCQSDSDRLWCAACAIRVCCLFTRGLDNCSQCADFPCREILDFEADVFDHHTTSVKRLRQMRSADG